MYIKMTFQYLKHNFQLYWIYFFTLAFGIGAFYIFNSIPTQQSLLDINRTLRHALIPLQEMIDWLSLVIALMMGTVIVYVNSFLLKRRKKELAVYSDIKISCFLYEMHSILTHVYRDFYGFQKCMEKNPPTFSI